MLRVFQKCTLSLCRYTYSDNNDRHTFLKRIYTITVPVSWKTSIAFGTRSGVGHAGQCPHRFCNRIGQTCVYARKLEFDFFFVTYRPVFLSNFFFNKTQLFFGLCGVVASVCFMFIQFKG